MTVQNSSSYYQSGIQQLMPANTSLPFPLHSAVESADIDQLNRLIALGNSGIYSLNEDGESVLHTAIRQKEISAIQAILPHVNYTELFSACSKDGLTINEFAIAAGDLAIVQLLLKKECLPRDALITTAVKYRQYAILRWLLENVTLGCMDCYALCAACELNDERSAFMLIEKITTKEKCSLLWRGKNATSLYFACLHQSMPIIEAIFQKCNEFDCLDYLLGKGGPEGELLEVVLREWNIPFISFMLKRIGPQYLLFAIGRSQQTTPLELICKHKDHEILAMALKIYSARLDPHDLFPSILQHAIEHSIVAGNLNNIKTVMQYGVDLNCRLRSPLRLDIIDMPSFLSLAIKHEQEKIAHYFLAQGAHFIDEEKMIADERALYYAIQNDCVELLSLFLTQAKLSNIPIDYKRCLNGTKFSFTGTTDFWHQAAWIKSRETLGLILSSYLVQEKALIPEVAEKITQKIIDMPVREFAASETMEAIVSFGLERNSDLNEWIDYCAQISQLTAAIFNSELKYVKKENDAIKSSKKTSKWFLQQLFQYIFAGMNPNLMQDKKSIEKIAALVPHLKPEHLDPLMIALQSNSSIEKITAALPYIGRPFPSKREFQTFDLAEHKGWLDYASIFRSRQSLSLCYSIIKRSQADDEILIRALESIEQIEIQSLNRFGQKRFLTLVQNTIALTDNQKVKIAAAKALWRVEQNPCDAASRNFLYSELQQYSHQQHDHEYLYTLVELLANYHHEDTTESVALLIKLLDISTDSHLRYAIAMSLSKIPHRDSLLAALAVVRSRDWSHHDNDYGMHLEKKVGSYLLFPTRPHGRHDNRLSMIHRILDQLVDLEWQAPSFQANLQHLLQAYRNNPDRYPQLQRMENKLVKDSRVRFVGTPIYFPPKSFLARAIGTRKGEGLFCKAFVDLLLKGCGSSDLSTGESEVDGGTWNKVGQIFTTHDLELFFDEEKNSYFTEDKGMLIVLSAEHFNRAYRRGEGRVEDELAINPIFYGGFKKDIIEAVYLPQALATELTLLYGNAPLDEVTPFLTSNFFKELSLKELTQIRRHLQHRESATGHNVVSEQTLFERFRFYSNSEPATLESLQRQFVFSSREEVYAETFMRIAARELIAEHLGSPSFFFMGQDQMIAELDDKAFLDNSEQFFGMMSDEICAMANVYNNHGKIETPNGTSQRVTLLQHTKEVLFGQYGGFGLKSDLFSSHSREEKEKIRALLRVSALFHDIGKLQHGTPLVISSEGQKVEYKGSSEAQGIKNYWSAGESLSSSIERDLNKHKNHTDNSVEIASHILAEKFRFFGLMESDIPMILALIKYNGLFGKFTHPRSSISTSQFVRALKKIHAAIPDSTISYSTFCHMLWVLYAADASTLRDVQKKRDLYEPLLNERAVLNFETCDWLADLKTRILDKNAAVFFDFQECKA